MSGRALWFAAGAGAGLYTSLRVRRLAYRLTPVGVADQLAAADVGVRAFTEEVRSGIAEREREIAERLGLGAQRALQPAPVEQVHLRPRELAAPAAARSS